MFLFYKEGYSKKDIYADDLETLKKTREFLLKAAFFILGGGGVF
jgi:hypothetical protein